MDQEIKALKSELALLKLQFGTRINQVEQSLNKLIESDNTDLANAATVAPAITLTAANVTVEQLPLVPEPVEITTTATTTVEPAVPVVPAVPPFIMIFLKSLLDTLFDWFAPAVKVYQSYQARGMLGIFSLTLVGIALTLAGFGYLMQLLIDQLGAGPKVLLMSLAAVSVMGLGIGLKIKTSFGEFATAIVTLGILLSYSTIYFSGSVYGIIPELAMLVLYIAVAITCHFLALLLNTRVVACLGIAGIAAMPIISDVIQIDTLYYLLSLAFVTASSLVLAYRNNWLWLANMCLAFSFVAIEWLIGTSQLELSIWVIDLFYLLFFCFVIGSLHQDKFISKQLLILLAATVGSSLMVFFQIALTFTFELSVIFVINAIIAIAAALLFHKIRHPLTHFLILLGAIWTLLAAISTLSAAYWPMAWAVEGLLLLYIGRHQQMNTVINQGQVLLSLALLYMFVAIVGHLPLPALMTVDGWVFCSVILITIATWQRMINKNHPFDHLARFKIKPALQLIEVVWLTVLLICSGYLLLGPWVAGLVILWQVAIMFRARQCQNSALEIFSAGLILVPLFCVADASLMIDSIRFSLLPMAAKLALLSAFIQLWLWSGFYRRYQPDSQFKAAAEMIRILFYLVIPLFWLGAAVRKFELDALIIVWLSPLLALLLTIKIKHYWLAIETKILTVIASLALVGYISSLSLSYSLIALAGFVSYYAFAFFGLAFWHTSKERDNQLMMFICRCAIITIGIVLPIIVGVQTDLPLYGGIVAAIYWSLCLNMASLFEQLKDNERVAVLFNIAIVLAAWPLTFASVYFGFIPLILLAGLLYKKDSRLTNSWLGKLMGEHRMLYLHGIFAVSYCMVMLALTAFRCDLLIAPLLASHGAIILFTNYQRIINVKFGFGLIMLGIAKLALVDATNALLWQKVVLFMGIGVLMLLASFWYQKLISQSDHQAIEGS